MATSSPTPASASPQDQAQQLQSNKFKPRHSREVPRLTKAAKKTNKKQEKQTTIIPEKKDKRYLKIDLALKRNSYRQDALIEVLHQVQGSFGYLDDAVLKYVTRKMKLPLSTVYGVASFYHLFSLKPQGNHSCVICLGTACYVKGANKIQETLEDFLQIAMGETTPDRKMSLLTARCMGACGIAPAISVDGEVLGKQTAESTLEKVKSVIDLPAVTTSNATDDGGVPSSS